MKINKDVIYNILIVLGIIFLIGLFCFVSFQIGKSRSIKTGIVEIKRDTICVIDTLKIVEPKEVIRYKDKLVYIPVIDTISIHDTIYASVEEEIVIYEEDDYKAIISGICPKLKEITIYPKTTYITEYQKEIIKKKWGINVTIGPQIGVFYNGKFGFGGGVGITFGYGYMIY